MKVLYAAILVLFMFSQPTYAFYLPIIPKRPRCMMVYSVGEAETVKIDLNLPAL